jgi:hypothetical protein
LAGHEYSLFFSWLPQPGLGLDDRHCLILNINIQTATFKLLTKKNVTELGQEQKRAAHLPETVAGRSHLQTLHQASSGALREDLRILGEQRQNRPSNQPIGIEVSHLLELL